jgi:hypothetical protein
MKAVLTKSLVVLAGAALVMPFVVVALLAGARASAGVEDGWGRLLLALLAISGALLGGTKGLGVNGAGAAEGRAARAVRWPEDESRTLMGNGAR